MREWLARRVQPNMCHHKIRCVRSYTEPSRMVDGEIVLGETFSQWQTCGRRPGHTGEHGSWGRWYRWRTIAANRLDQS